MHSNSVFKPPQKKLGSCALLKLQCSWEGEEEEEEEEIEKKAGGYRVSNFRAACSIPRLVPQLLMLMLVLVLFLLDFQGGRA